MARSARLIFCYALISLSISLLTRPAFCTTLGGWTIGRGNQASIFPDANFGGQHFAPLRADLATYFPDVTLSETSELTSAYLNTIDVLYLDPVWNDNNIAVSPLSTAEQSALTGWVAAGGRALIVGENTSYAASSKSMIEPFGPHWAIYNSGGGGVPATITNHSSFPAITNGSFGVVNTFAGDYVSFFDDPSPATSLGDWSIGGSSLAALNYGLGHVVFFGDSAIAVTNVGDNAALRRNTLTYLLQRNVQYDYNHNGATDAADYVLWRHSQGQSGAGLAADGNDNHQIDSGDYNLWRLHFGETAGSGSGALANAAVPEPTTLVLLMLAVAGWCLQRGRSV
jgi:PEP-CTERM motif